MNDTIATLLLSVNSAAKALDVSRATIYSLMKNGSLNWVQFGADRRIPVEEIRRVASEGAPLITKDGKKAALL